MAQRAGGPSRQGGKKGSSGKMPLSSDEQWEIGNPNAAANNTPTEDERAQQLIDVLRSYSVSELELVPVRNVPGYRQNQGDVVDPQNVTVCGKYTAMGSRRRDYIWLLISGEEKKTREQKRKIRRELDDLEQEVAVLFRSIKKAGGIPVDFPEEFDDYPVYPKKK